MLRCWELRAEMPAQRFPKSSGTGPEMTGGTWIVTADIGTTKLAYGTWFAWMFSVHPVDSRRCLNIMVISLPHTMWRQMAVSTSPRRMVSSCCSPWVFGISFEWREFFHVFPWFFSVSLLYPFYFLFIQCTSQDNLNLWVKDDWI